MGGVREGIQAAVRARRVLDGQGQELDDLVVLRVKKKAREMYVRETRYTSTATDETIDQSKQENLSRLTEEGQQEANDAVKLLQDQAEESLVAAQRELRAKVEAVEDARVCVAGVEYFNKLPLSSGRCSTWYAPGSQTPRSRDSSGSRVILPGSYARFCRVRGVSSRPYRRIRSRAARARSRCRFRHSTRRT